MLENTQSDSLITALVSGTSAAVVTATLTFPFDSIKTQLQLHDSTYMARHGVLASYPTSIAQIFKGASASVAGAVLKNGTRLVLYNWLSRFMAIDNRHHNGHSMKTNAPRIVVAGAILGLIETVVLIPFENIKINMIQNMLLFNELKSPASSRTLPARTSQGNIFMHQYILPNAYYSSDMIAQAHGKSVRQLGPEYAEAVAPLDALRKKYNARPPMTFSGVVREMYDIRGARAFFAGTCITMVRQIAVSTLWMWTYNVTRQAMDPHSTSQNWFGHAHTPVQLMGLHLLSCAAVISATMPLDVIKTRLQSKNGKYVYKDSLTTAYRLVMQEGFKSLYRGALPRAFKVLVSGGLTAAVYQYMERIAVEAGNQKVFNN